MSNEKVYFHLMKHTDLSVICETDADGRPWYAQGLDFSCCEGCDKCCAEEEGYAYLSDYDLDVLSKAAGLTREQTMEVYCRKVDMGSFCLVALKERSNHDCIFIKDKKCSMYSARPFQCASYPFWPNVMASRETWEAEKSACPGIGHGRHWSEEEITSVLEAKAYLPLLEVSK